jgi:hypothetical protein
MLLGAMCVAVAGCGGMNMTPSGPVATPLALHGIVHGGQQPITGATISLFAAGTSGYGTGATSLLTAPVSTDGNGNFTITGEYQCPSTSSQLYILSTGGNPGLPGNATNGAIALMAALGPCSLFSGKLTLDPDSFIVINEVSTVAAVYALHGFMTTSSSQVGTSSTNAVGLANAFQLVNNLVTTSTGVPATATTGGNGTVPQATINSLADILAACVNSTGVGDPCSTIFGAALPTVGSAPTDTIQAIYNIASNPANQVGTLYGQISATAPFQPTLGSTAPNDFTVALLYAGGGLSANSMAIDGSGNAWFYNSPLSVAPTVTKLNSNGAIQSGTNGFSTGGVITTKVGNSIAIDPNENVWVPLPTNGSVAKLNGSSGALMSGASGFPGFGSSIAIDGQGAAWMLASTGILKMDNSGNVLSGAGFSTGNGHTPSGISIDKSGNAWVADGTFVNKFDTNGNLLSTSPGYQIPGIEPISLGFDFAGDVWSDNTVGIQTTFVGKLDSNGNALSPTGGYSTCSRQTTSVGMNFCIGWANNPFALDGAGNLWSVQAVQTETNGRPPVFLQPGPFGVAELSNAGAILSGITGYTGGYGPTIDGGASALAVDGGGNLWALFGGTVAEFVGAATPVVTPFSVGAKNQTLGMRP